MCPSILVPVNMRRRLVPFGVSIQEIVAGNHRIPVDHVVFSICFKLILALETSFLPAQVQLLKCIV